MGNMTARWGALGGIGALGVGAALALRERAAHRPGMTPPDGAPRVVILGAGFGGLTAARTLVERLAPGQAAITLVDRNNYHLFTPLLYQIAACAVLAHCVAGTGKLSEVPADGLCSVAVPKVE